jgi:hypothetical protein
MAAIVVDHLWKTFQDGMTSSGQGTGVVFLYCNYRRREEQGATNLLAALLKQLVTGRPSISEVRALYDTHTVRGTRPSLEDISRLLRSAIGTYSRVYIVIDALDECRNDDGTRRVLFSEIRHLQSLCDIRLMATSRFIPDIEQEFKGASKLEIRASDEDVGRYFDSQMFRLPDFVLRNTKLQQLIKEGIIEAADGM